MSHCTDVMVCFAKTVAMPMAAVATATVNLMTQRRSLHLPSATRGLKGGEMVRQCPQFSLLSATGVTDCPSSTL